jgi:hypothetical protein
MSTHKPAIRSSSIFGLFILLVIGPAFVIRWTTWCVIGPVFPASQIALIHVGDSKEKVKNVLGKPQKVFETKWIYSHEINSGWVEIRFDHDGLVKDVNDESMIQW